MHSESFSDLLVSGVRVYVCVCVFELTAASTLLVILQVFHHYRSDIRGMNKSYIEYIYHNSSILIWVTNQNNENNYIRSVSAGIRLRLQKVLPF